MKPNNEYCGRVSDKCDEHCITLSIEQAERLIEYLDFVYREFCPKGFFASKPERYDVEFKLLNNTTDLKQLINKKYFDATVPESERSCISAKCTGELKFG